MPLDSKCIEASFSPTSTDALYLQIDQVPKYQDLAISVVTTDRQIDEQTDYFTPAHAHGVITWIMESSDSKFDS